MNNCKTNHIKIGNSSLKSNNLRHRGHVRSILNHSSRQFRWNVCPHENVSVLFELKLSRQIRHCSSCVVSFTFSDFFNDCPRSR